MKAYLNVNRFFLLVLTIRMETAHCLMSLSSTTEDSLASTRPRTPYVIAKFVAKLLFSYIFEIRELLTFCWERIGKMCWTMMGTKGLSISLSEGYA